MLLQLVVLVAVVLYGHDEVVPEKHENSEHRVDAVVASFAAGDGASFVAVADENTFRFLLLF